MNNIESLITAARRYCEKNFAYWFQKYQDERSQNPNPSHYTDNEFKFSSRYNCLQAILIGVETLVGEKFSSDEECKMAILNQGANSHSTFTRGKTNDVQRKAMEQVRAKFAEYIQGLKEADLKDVLPMPFKKRLLHKAGEIREHLKQKWNFDGKYWEPITKCSPMPSLFLSTPNVTAEDHLAIGKFIQSISKDYIYWISENKLDYQIHKESFTLDLYEIVCCDDSYNWIVYGSHDATIAFGGDALLAFVKKQFNTRQELLNAW